MVTTTYHWPSSYDHIYDLEQRANCRREADRGLSQTPISHRRRNPTSTLTPGYLALCVNIQRSERCYCTLMRHFPANAAATTKKSVRNHNAPNDLCTHADTSMGAARMSRSTARGWDKSRYLSSRSCETSETLMCHEFPRTGRVLEI
jgi:hypothetical protein